MTSIPVQLPLFPADGKVCRVCGDLFPLDSFGFHNTVTGKRRTLCKTCDKAKSANYRAAHPDHNKQYKRANAAQQSANFHAWRLANLEHNRAVVAAWQQANAGRVRANTLRRKYHLESNGGHYTGAEWAALKARYDYRCLMCGRQEPEIKLTFDHVIPVSKGGTNEIGNAQCLCQPCNTRKKDKILDLR